MITSILIFAGGFAVRHFGYKAVRSTNTIKRRPY
jgi:hypothetical protein